MDDGASGKHSIGAPFPFCSILGPKRVDLFYNALDCNFPRGAAQFDCPATLPA